MTKFKFSVTLVIFLFLSAYLNAQSLSIQQTLPTSSRLFSVVGVNNTVFRFNVVLPLGTTSAIVSAKINGVTYNQTIATSGNVDFSWTSPSYGAFLVKGFVTTNNLLKDSTASFNFKVIQSTTCGIQIYNNTVGYSTNDEVAVNDSVYRRTSWWAQGDAPHINSTTWAYLGQCNSNLYTIYDCSQMPNWNSSTTYSSGGNIVSYNGLVVKNTYWSLNDIPTSNTVNWKIIGACGIVNQLPIITSAYVNDTNIVLNPLQSFSFTASITDVDGTINHVIYKINGTPLSSTNVASNYIASFTPPTYGNYTLQIIAIDDEQGADTTTTNINFVPAIPPIIIPNYPINNQVITNINNVNIGTSINLQATVTDLNYIVNSVTYTINGSSVITATSAGNVWSAVWMPTAYGNYTLTIKAKNNQNAESIKTINFVLENPNLQNLTISTLPLQLKMNLGNTKSFVLDSSIQSVNIRNQSLAKVSINGNILTITGYRTGRSGLRITTNSGAIYFVGIRVNNADGTPPGLPGYASLGFVSEDSPSDLDFWKDVDTNLTNKNMDVRYIYINDGPIGYTTWRDSTRHITFCKNSLKLGLTPYFVYYNIPDAGESFSTDLAHMQDTAYMTAYFNDLTSFLRQCHEVMGEELFGIVLEPDVLGYMQQLGGIQLGNNDPNTILTAVSANNIAVNAGTLKTLVTRINKTIKDRKDLGANIRFGWQLNLWADGTTAGSNGIMRTTDETTATPPGLGWVAGRANVIQGATNVANYIINCGVTTNGADFISIDKYGLDAVGYNSNSILGNPWWFNNDNWDNYMLYAKTIHTISGKPMVLWQLPVGHINNSTTTSAYTNSTYPPLPNTTAKYEDPCLTYFFGDTFVVNDAVKYMHLTKNNSLDTGLHTLTGNTIVWAPHISKFNETGIEHAMFGAGVGNSTNGIHDPACQTCGPSDSYFSIQKMQNYYQNGLVWIDTTLFYPNILTFNMHDTNTHKLPCYLGSLTNMYYYKNVTDSGYFKPSNLPIGLNYITYVDASAAQTVYKVVRVKIDTSGSNNQMIKLVTLGTHVIADKDCPSSNSWIYFKDPSDGRYVTAIHPNGNSWNPDTVAVYANTSVYNNGFNTVGVSKRYLSINAPGSYTVNGGLKLRFYFNPSDTSNLLPTIPYFSTWYKCPVQGPNAVNALVNSTTLNNYTIPHITSYGLENGIHYVEFDSLQSFSTFGFFAQTMPSIPLSVNDLAFKVTNNNCRAKLFWEAENETDIERYEIEISLDAINFENLGAIKSLQNTSKTSYQFPFVAPEGKSYYRLKIINNSSQTNYSSVVSLNNLCENNSFLATISPNPVMDNKSITLHIKSKDKQEINILIYSENGKQIGTIKKSILQGETNFSLDQINRLSSGIYFLKIKTQTGIIQNLKLIKN